MDFSWRPETLDLIATYERFAAADLARRPAPAGLDLEAWRACAEQGLLRLLDGADTHPHTRGLLPAVAVFEALGRAGADRGLLFALGAHLFGCQMPIRLHAGEARQAAWANELASGRLVGALGVTEPQGGSSASQMQTTAERQGDHYRLNGRKTLITNATAADLFLILAATRPERGSFGWTAFVVEQGTAGLSVEPLSTAGLAGAPMGDVHLRNCRVPVDHVIGAPETGLRVFTSAMQWERTGILAGFLGAAERDLAACIEYINARRDASGPLGAHQAISHRIALAKLRLERARLLLLHAAWTVEGRHRSAQQAVALAKYEASEAVVETAMDVLRITAGAGWQDRLGAATALRDSLGTLFASGTPEVQLNIVASSLGLKRR